MEKTKISGYLKPYWKTAVISPLFMVGEVAVDLAEPTLMAMIVDQGVLKNDLRAILLYGLAMLLLAIVGGGMGVGASGFASVASNNMGNDLRQDTFQRVMHLSLQQTDQFTTGSLVTRLTNDISAVQDLVVMALRGFVRAPLSFLGGIVCALAISVRFSYVLLIVLPIEILVIWLLLRKANPLFTIVQQKLDRVNAVVQENVTGARMVKAYVREEYECQRFQKANQDLMSNNLRVQRIMAALSPLLMIFMNAGVIAVIYIGGWQVQAQELQVGKIMAGVTYITQILMSVMMVSNMFQTISRSTASAARIREVLDTEPVIRDGNSDAVPGRGTLEFRKVAFRYPGAAGSPVLHDIDLTIHPGETVAILGSTGAGKTSLVNLISRFYDPIDGEILLDGRPLQDYTLEALRQRIGFVLQKSELFSGTIADNIRWGNPEATDAEVVAAAKIAQADDFISGFKQGYETVIGEKGASLSGGQKQRLCIARAILKKPEILIFDDSTSALDLGTESRLQAALRENLQDTTVIMIAQRVASAQNADRIAVLDGGTLAGCDTQEHLLRTCGVYQDIYDSQMGKGAASNA